MLARIKVENFKSFDKEMVLNMISSTKIRSKMDHSVQVASKLKFLKHAVIYGANASGKSNLIDCISFFKDVVENGLPINCQKLYCRNKEENRAKDSHFEIQIEIEGKFYAFGFSAILSERRITGE